MQSKCSLIIKNFVPSIVNNLKVKSPNIHGKKPISKFKENLILTVETKSIDSRETSLFKTYLQFAGTSTTRSIIIWIYIIRWIHLHTTHYSANSFLCALEVDERFSKNFPSTAFWLKEYQINNILQLIILLEKFSHRYMMWSLHLEPQMLKQSIAQHSPKTAKLLEYSAQHAEKQLDPGYI